jgi:hypothetical protein
MCQIWSRWAAVLLPAVGFFFSIHAKTFEWSFLIDAEQYTINTHTDSAGNTGKILIIDKMIKPFYVNTLDKIVTHVDFVQPVVIRQESNEYYNDSIVPGNEELLFTYWFPSPPINNFTSVKNSVALRITEGIPVKTSFQETFGCFGNGFLPMSEQTNLTDSYIVLKGIDMQTNIVNISTPSTVNHFSLDILAGNITIIPEPCTLALLALGGMALIRRHKA